MRFKGKFALENLFKAALHMDIKCIDFYYSPV